MEYREEPCRSALNRVQGMPFNWSLNPYTGCAHRCSFCYVRAFERRADRPSDARYGTSVRIKVNIAQVLAGELARRSWKGEMVAIGAATDPYQPAEGRYRLTRACLETLATAANPFTLITRGPLVVRDVDVLQRASARADVSVSVSIPTLKPDVWRTTEPGTAPPSQRLRAVQILVKAGIRAGVAIAPVLPGLSDDPAGLAEVVRAARDVGASHVWARVLYLPPGTREHFLEQLARDWPEQLSLYESWYGAGAYLPRSRTAPILELVQDLRHRFDLAGRLPPAMGPPPEPVQLALSM